MALDTRDKRDSAIAVSLPWRMRFPVPDGSLAAADRLHLALLYRGIAASAPAGPTVAVDLPERVCAFDLPQRSPRWDLSERVPVWDLVKR